jgi:hypothetical protein
METQKSKIVFIEYGTYDEKQEQHFLTAILQEDHKRTIIGRVYCIENKETKEWEYVAKDHFGNRIFKDEENLFGIKMEFKRQGESLAKLVPPAPNKTKRFTRPRTYSQILTREQLIGIHRERIAENNKDKKQEVTKTNKQDLRRIERTKDQEQIKEVETSKEKEQEITKSNPDEPIQEETIENEKSEREIELENIREDKEDDRGDVEIDI